MAIFFDSGDRLALKPAAAPEPAHRSNWRAVQAEHCQRQARLAIAFAAAYEGEANWVGEVARRAYLMSRARELRRDAAQRLSKADELSPVIAR